VATNIHLDQSSPLRKQWSPLCAEPPWGEEISIEHGPQWTTCPGEGASLLWWLDIAGSFASKCSWCILGWALLVSTAQQHQMCPIVEESVADIGPHWTLGVDQWMMECWARRHCPLQPWWWCMTHIEAKKSCGGAQRGASSVNVTKLCLPPRTYVALDIDHDAACTWNFLYPICHRPAGGCAKCTQWSY